MARKKMNILVLISYTIIVSCAVDIVDQTPIKIYNYISEPNFFHQILCIHRFNDIFLKKNIRIRIFESQVTCVREELVTNYDWKISSLQLRSRL